MQRTHDLKVTALRPLPRPADLSAAHPRTDTQARQVVAHRTDIERILRGQDRRLLAIVGPCSIHDVDAGFEYAQRLAALAAVPQDRVKVVMRVYFEKPRTATGWQGLILDPHLDGSGDIAHGLGLARAFLRRVVDLGLATGTEFLDPISPQYIADLVCWASIGARTAESQAHRQLASGLSMPVGFKNGTCGSIQNAVNAIKAARQPHTFFGIDSDGRAAAVHTRGNSDGHLVLRGGSTGPNFDAVNVARAEAALERAALPRALIVDCSHDNSGRMPQRQPAVVRAVLEQVSAGNRAIVGIMVESNLHAGAQALGACREKLRYGVSITDPCLDWRSTEDCLRELHAALAERLGSATSAEAAVA